MGISACTLLANPGTIEVAVLRIQHNDNNKDNNNEDNNKWMLAPYLQTLGKIEADALH